MGDILSPNMLQMLLGKVSSEGQNTLGEKVKNALDNTDISVVLDISWW